MMTVKDYAQDTGHSIAEILKKCNTIVWNGPVGMFEEEKYSRGGEFVENLVTDNELEFCNRWLKLGNFSDVINDIDEFYGNEYGIFSTIMNDTSIIHPIIPISDKIETPIMFNEGKVISPISFDYVERDNEFNYENLLLKENDK